MLIGFISQFKSIQDTMIKVVEMERIRKGIKNFRSLTKKEKDKLADLISKNLQQYDLRGNTPLITAAHHGDVYVAEFIIIIIKILDHSEECTLLKEVLYTESLYTHRTARVEALFSSNTKFAKYLTDLTDEEFG